MFSYSSRSHTQRPRTVLTTGSPLEEDNVQYREGSSKPRSSGLCSRMSKAWLAAKDRGLGWYVLYAICLVAASVGFFFQITDIFGLYFAYETVTELDIRVPTAINAPAVSMCFMYSEILNRTLLKKTKWEPLMDKEFIELGDLTDITLEDIMDMTPQATFLRQCSYREPMRYGRTDSAPFCEAFSLDRYFKQQYMCYQAKMKGMDSTLFFFEFIQSALKSPGAFYELYFAREPVINSTVVQFTVHKAGLRPRGRSAFPVVVGRYGAFIPLSEMDSEAEDVQVSDWAFYVTYSVYKSNLLMAPYASNCLDYTTVDYESQGHCIDACTTEKAEALLGSKVPFNVLSSLPRKETIINVVDNSNKSVADVLFQIHETCYTECRFPNCVDFVYVTKLIKSETGSKGFFKVRLYVSNEPTIESTTNAKIEMTEFLVYVLSLFGIWFGLSLYGLVFFLEKSSSALYSFWCTDDGEGDT